MVGRTDSGDHFGSVLVALLEETKSKGILIFEL